MSEQARNDTNRRCFGNFLQCDAQMVLRGVSLLSRFARMAANFH